MGGGEAMDQTYHGNTGVGAQRINRPQPRIRGFIFVCRDSNQSN